MNKKFVSLFLLILLTACLCVPAAADHTVCVADEAGLLQDPEPLEVYAQELLQKYGIAVSYVSVDDAYGVTLAELAENLYEKYVGAADGIMLLDCLSSDRYRIHLTGSAANMFTREELERLLDGYDQADTYDTAVYLYLQQADSLLNDKMGDSGGRSLLLLDEPQPDTAQTPGIIPEERQLPLVVDQAGVVNEERLAALNEKAERLSQTYSCDTAVVFVKSTNGMDTLAFADDFYDYNGYGHGSGDNGILLLIAVEDRRFAVSTYGTAGISFSDYGQQYMDSKYIPHLKESDWTAAADSFLDVCDELLAFERSNGQPYDVNNLPKKDTTGIRLIGSLAVGFLAAMIPVSAMKGKMRTIREKQDAADYLRAGSFHLHRRQDRFITSHVTRVPRPKETGTRSNGGGGGSSFHVSSSGRSHGGHSGSF